MTRLGIFALASLALALGGGSALATAETSAPAAAGAGAGATGSAFYSLAFDPRAYTVKTLSVGGQTITYRAFERIVYVARPVDTKYQSLNFYVPEAYYSGKSVGGYTAATAPIFFPNGIGGYMPAEAKGPENTGPAGLPAGAAMPAGALPPGAVRPAGGPDSSGPSPIFVALSKGYVVASPGSRGRTTQASDGSYTGKAPACIVDLKAAVRYLRFNDKAMPGNAERIISNGTSAGGAMSALLGASGNSPDYLPYLQALGAADARDDVYAVSAYCPITNLDKADLAYEWQFQGINGYSGMFGSGTMSAAQVQASAQLASLFPAYLNGLGLRKADGSPLSLDAQGRGSFRDYITSLLVASAQKALKGGKDLSSYPWLTIKDGTVTALDLDSYVAYMTRMKSTPAFDAFDGSAAENSLFGTSTANAQHFTPWGLAGSTVAATMADPVLVGMMNPMGYVGAPGATTAQFWRIRHGASDRDGSFPVPVILAAKLEASGKAVDLALPWGQGHGGDYDLEELFAWIAQACR